MSNISLEELKHRDNALDQSVALNKIVLDLLEERKKEFKRLWTMFIAVCCIFAVTMSYMFKELRETRIDFMEYLDSIETVVTETITTETVQTVEGDSAEINNIQGNQYKDNAVHNDFAPDSEEEGGD